LSNNKEINWQEVAEETAENLGWKLHKWENFQDAYWVGSHKDGWEPVMSYQIYAKPDSLLSVIFSWPTFCLMLQKAEKMGYVFNVLDRVLGFDSAKHETGMKNYQEHGHIKACAMAFNEIFKKEGE